MPPFALTVDAVEYVVLMIGFLPLFALFAVIAVSSLKWQFARLRPHQGQYRSILAPYTGPDGVFRVRAHYVGGISVAGTRHSSCDGHLVLLDNYIWFVASEETVLAADVVDLMVDTNAVKPTWRTVFGYFVPFVVNYRGVDFGFHLGSRIGFVAGNHPWRLREHYRLAQALAWHLDGARAAAQYR